MNEVPPGRRVDGDEHPRHHSAGWAEILSGEVGQAEVGQAAEGGNLGLADKNLRPFMDAITQNYARPMELFENENENLRNRAKRRRA